ncbi:MAG: hypothetical protein HY717_04265 [Planctomycetes bacterium]|nr:hypothetical protein [Planctomycetota bacterium]
MIEVYLDAAIRQARERAKLLKKKIPQPVKAVELVALQTLCEARIDGIISQLDYLLTDQVILVKELIKERIRIFRRTRSDLSQVETTAIAALSRIHDDEIFLNKLVFRIHKEINYPLSPPTVTCLSKDYFSINTSLHLLEVPLAESDFLLHLPDLYHEIAHLLIAATNNPKVEPFQQELGKFLFCASQHFEAERAANIRATGPTGYFAQVLDLLERYWMHWATELFCDLFAIYTLGPAYAWAHFHLTAGHEGDPYDVRFVKLMSHPPDEARMEVMLLALRMIGFQSQAADIQQQWDALVKSTGAVQAPMYRKACAQPLLQQAAIHALEGTRKIGCRIVQEKTTDKVHDLLNTAWNKFWTSPNEYHQWERDWIAKLKIETKGV